VFTLGRRISRTPFEAGQHFGPVVLLNHTTTGDAGEMRVLRPRGIERREHVVPFENLHVVTVRAMIVIGRLG
jgi:hypothetical protein